MMLIPVCYCNQDEVQDENKNHFLPHHHHDLEVKQTDLTKSSLQWLMLTS